MTSLGIGLDEALGDNLVLSVLHLSVDELSPSGILHYMVVLRNLSG